jgi:hypothetical protein
MLLNSYDFTIRFASGDSAEIRHTDWLSRESFEPITEQDRAKAIDQHPNERMAEENKCADCNPEELDKGLYACKRHEMTQHVSAVMVCCETPPRVPTVRVKCVRINNREPVTGVYTVEPVTHEIRVKEVMDVTPKRIMNVSVHLPHEIEARFVSETPPKPQRACRPRQARRATGLAQPGQHARAEATGHTQVTTNAEKDANMRVNNAPPINEALENNDQPVEETEHVKRVANYMIHYSKIHDKLDKFVQHTYPLEKLITAQEEDEFSSNMKSYLQDNELPAALRTARHIAVMSDQFVLRDQLLYHIEVPSGKVAHEVFKIQLYLPDRLQPQVATEIHQEMHFSVEKMVQRLRETFWWPQMYKIAQRIVDNCEVCEADRKLRQPYRAPLKSAKAPNGPAQSWYLDHFGPIPTAKSLKGHSVPKYVLLAVDAYSLYTEVIPVTSTSAKETAQAILERVIANHSFPISLRHDRGAAFTSKVLEKLTQGISIKRYIGAAMAPRTQGCVESRVKIISKALRRLANSRRGEWYTHLPAIQLGFNSVPTRQTGLPPFLLQSGRCPRDPTSLAFEVMTRGAQAHREVLVGMVRTLKVWRATVQKNRQIYKEYMKRQYDKGVNVPRDLLPGELVYMSCPYLNVKNKGIRRLNIPFRGPFVIVERVNEHLCRLARVSDLTELPNLVSVARLKLTNLGLDVPDYQFDEDLDADDYDDVPLAEHVNQPWDISETDASGKEGGGPEVVRRGIASNPTEGAPEVNQRDVSMVPEVERGEKDGGDVAMVPNNATTDDEPEIGSDPAQTSKDVLPESEANSEMAKAQSQSAPSGCSKVKLRVPPRIRVTRAGQRQLEATYQEVTKICSHRIDGRKQEWVKVLCHGDKPSQAKWVQRQSLIGPGVQGMIDECRKVRKKSEPGVLSVLRCVKGLWK